MRWRPDILSFSWLTHGLCAIALMLCAAGSSSAQTLQPCPTPCTVDAGKVFAVQFSPSAVDATHGAPTEYRLFIDGQVVGSPISATASGDITVGNLTLSAVGPHTVQVAGANAGGVSPLSAPYAFSITVPTLPPNAPTNVRILITATIQADGSLGLKWQLVDVNGKPITPEE